MQLRNLLPSLFALLSLTSGCGDDTAPPGGGVDAGPGVDAGTRDGGPVDSGGLDGAVSDGAVGDGSVPDGGTVGCILAFDPEMDVMPLATDSVSRERVVPLAANASGFAAIWTETSLGIPDVYARRLAPDGRIQPTQPVTSDTARSIDPTVVAVGTDYLASWVDNSEGGFEVFARTLGSDLMSAGDTHRLTDNAVRDDSPTLLRNGSGVLAAWVRDDSTAGTRTAVTRRLGTDGAPSAAAADVTGAERSPGAPQLAPRAGGSALVWAESALDSDVLLLPLDAGGAAAGAPIALNTEGNADGVVDAAMTESGGAVVFGVSVAGVRSEVRFQALTGGGERFGDEIILTPAPESGRDASIVAFRGGYVVTYRAIADEGLTEPVLRLVVLDSAGERVDAMDLASVAETGGRTTVRASPEGDRLVVTWADPTGSETELRLARLSCE